MLGWLKDRKLRQRTGQQLYERIVAQSRDPDLYAKCGVPDTMDGRLEMVLLHTVLTLDRLHAEGAAGQRLGQQVMEHLVADMDDALRRIGLGDDSVSPRIKRLASAIAERARDYRSGFADATAGSTDDPLEVALLEHVFAATDATAPNEARAGVRLLASYARRARPELERVASREILAGNLAFPPVLEPTGTGLETRS